ncbi:MAG: PaaI family thioesterase [Desulfuromonadales bacterium]|nr:PaaI family thioesterase [Desulfuromonadales bacterium]
MEVSDNQYCFVCGKNNPVGLKTTLQVDRETQSASCELVIPAEYQGWEGMVHGGIIAALLDEVCAYAGMTVSEQVVTGELKTRFRKPVPVEQLVTVSAKVAKQARRTVMVEAQLAMDGRVLAGAEAKMVVLK